MGTFKRFLVQDCGEMRPRNGAEFSVDNSIGEATFRVSSDVRPDGGIGRRAGLKIQFPLKKCGFDPHSGHQKADAPSEGNGGLYA